MAIVQRTRRVCISVWGMTGLAVLDLSEQGDKDLHALLDMIAKTPRHERTDGESWKDHADLPALVCLKDVDGSEFWACPWNIVAVNFGAWIETPPPGIVA